MISANMGAYYVNEAAFEIDEVFEDRTVHVLAARDDLPGDVSLLVSRLPYGRGESLRDVVTRHVARESRALAGWESLFEKTRHIPGASVIELGIRWRGTAGLVYQHQAHIGLSGSVLTLLASGPIAEKNACDHHLERALKTFRIREG